MIDPLLFEPPRWPGGPPICQKENRPAFPTEADMAEFQKSNGSAGSIKSWLCPSCSCYHYLPKPFDPAGSSSGSGRSSKTIALSAPDSTRLHEGTLLSISELLGGQQVNEAYHRLVFLLDDNTTAHVDAVLRFRNYKNWKPLDIGARVCGLLLLSPGKLNGDSPVRLLPPLTASPPPQKPPTPTSQSKPSPQGNLPMA